MRHLYLLLTIISFQGFCQLPVSLELYNHLQRVDDDTEVPVLIQGNQTEMMRFLGNLHKKPIYSTKKIARSTISKNQILQAQGLNLYFDGGTGGQTLNDSTRFESRVINIHEGINLDKPYKGKSVIIGIIDTGIDYRHPDFNDENGKSRILSIWDQNLSGNAPPNYNYGYECDSIAIANKTCPSTDGNFADKSHGTHVAGTAAGFDQINDGKFTGMAPEANIIGVAIDFSNFYTAVIDGAKYIYDIAQEKGMPAVINLSAGSYSGAHDGKNLITYALNDLITAYPGRAFVTAAGNGGLVYHHAKHQVNQIPQFTYFKTTSNGFIWNLYADSIDFEKVNFKLQIDSKSTYTKLGETPTLNVLQDFPVENNQLIQKNITVYDENANTLGNITFLMEKFESRYGLKVYIENSPANTYWRYTSWGEGQLDIYSSSLTGTSTMVKETELPTDFSELSSYTSPDLTQNTAGYFSASQKTISVGNYVGKKTFSNYNGDPVTIDATLTPQDRYRKSSIGPNRDGYIKPDITANGTWVRSASNEDYLLWRIENNQYLNSVYPDNLHFTRRGTSMAAPAVAGGIALLFEYNPNLSSQEINDLVINNARKDEFTTSTENNLWGYGKFDMQNIFNSITASPLPIKWLSFTVNSSNNSNALINWVTASESNIKHFNVLKSFDTQTWEIIQQLNATNTDETTHYSTTDNNLPTNQRIYYKIESVEFDETKDYTDIRTILIEDSNNWKIAENPVQGTINIISPPHQEYVEIAFYSTKGQLVKRVEIENTSNTTSIPINNLSQGNYFVEVTVNNRIVLSKNITVIK